MPISSLPKHPVNSLSALEATLTHNKTKIEHWFEEAWTCTPVPFYCSVDIRNAGFKLAPVDTNLFPAGFNNLDPTTEPLCINAIKKAIARQHPNAQRLLLLTEDHTRNQFYFESVTTLQAILTQAQFDIRLASLKQTTPRTVTTPSGKAITLHPVSRKGDRLTVGHFDPDLIILNNDLSSGIPSALTRLEQTVMPSPCMSWASRLKSDHFQRYKSVAARFAELLAIDPWLISPLSSNCGEIDFMKRTGEECLIKHSRVLLQAIAEKYRQQGITRPPFVVIKADAGTYGMSVMMAHSTDELKQLNRKQRTKMAASKGGKTVSEVIIQEGVYTIDTITLADNQQATAEPVIYMIDNEVVGGFYRAHAQRLNNENLNAPGMQFKPFSPLSKSLYPYSVIARLALLSAGRELALQNKK